MSPFSRPLIGAVILFGVIALIVLTRHTPPPASVVSLDIGVEHTLPITLEVTITRNDTLRMIEVTNDPAEAIALSVPTDWQRFEVRNVPLQNVIADEPAFGYTRWHLPKTAGIGYRTKKPFEHLTLHNPSGIPLKIRLTVVDLLKNTGEKNVYLVQEGSIRLP